jgi:hypothetical protein
MLFAWLQLVGRCFYASGFSGRNLAFEHYFRRSILMLNRRFTIAFSFIAALYFVLPLHAAPLAPYREGCDTSDQVVDLTISMVHKNGAWTIVPSKLITLQGGPKGRLFRVSAVAPSEVFPLMAKYTSAHPGFAVNNLTPAQQSAGKGYYHEERWNTAGHDDAVEVFYDEEVKLGLFAAGQLPKKEANYKITVTVACLSPLQN